MPIALATAEDVIRAKLEWAKLGESQRLCDDALAVARVQQNELDIEHLRQWAAVLHLETLLQKLLDAAELPRQ